MGTPPPRFTLAESDALATQAVGVGDARSLRKYLEASLDGSTALKGAVEEKRGW